MDLTNETRNLLTKIGLEYIETILDRRGTLALRVSLNGSRAVLKLQSEDESEESRYKSQLLLHEAEVLSQIPHLTNHLYINHGSIDGKHWLLIREIDGQEVHQSAKQIREKFPTQEERIQHLMDILLKVSGFYEKLYSGGYLHGDIQPAHVYLEHNEITVIDWGLVRKIDEPNPFYKGGFIYFVAPEIAKSMRSGEANIEYTTRAEVYSLGATLYMFYTGNLGLDFGVPKTDLKQTPMGQKLQRVIENKILSFEDIGADQYPALEALLRKSLSTDPQERFATPSLFHQHLLKLRS